ncbi:unnamed protein product [Acanthosepion pharaonis]|uniref:Uncharacterized protein n=1 Tax=Acanthosepion pharaonis TaxID=158019 RepID=A0A812DBQ6_ACAPH|nr:unnamed protein product [Sepia pharaonis]
MLFFLFFPPTLFLFSLSLSFFMLTFLSFTLSDFLFLCLYPVLIIFFLSSSICFSFIYHSVVLIFLSLSNHISVLHISVHVFIILAQSILLYSFSYLCAEHIFVLFFFSYLFPVTFFTLSFYILCPPLSSPLPNHFPFSLLYTLRQPDSDTPHSVCLPPLFLFFSFCIPPTPPIQFITFFLMHSHFFNFFFFFILITDTWLCYLHSPILKILPLFFDKEKHTTPQKKQKSKLQYRNYLCHIFLFNLTPTYISPLSLLSLSFTLPLPHSSPPLKST